MRNIHHYLLPRLFYEIYKAGFDTIFAGRGDIDALSNLHITSWAARFLDGPQIWRRTPPPRKVPHVREPCLNDPEHLKELREKLTGIAERYRPFSTTEFSLASEGFFSRVAELCFSPHCVTAFHQLLKERYTGIEELNRKWGLNFLSFEEIFPVTLAEAKEDPRLIPLWVSYRRHMESTWAGIFEFSRDVIQEVIPGARTGYDATDVFINSIRAADFWKLTQVMTLNQPYVRPFLNEMLRDFAQPGTMLGLGWCGGYNRARSKPVQRFTPWHRLFQGATSHWIFFGHPGHGGSVIASDFSFYDFFQENIREVGEIKRGTGKLLITSERDSDRMAVLYSASSVHSSTLTPELPRMECVLFSFGRLFVDSGHQFRVMAYAQLEKGMLNEGGFDFLFLPFTQSLSDKEAAEIITFVERGGTVIADLRPGVSDERGKARKGGGILDAVFGIRQDTQRPQVKEAEILFRHPDFPERFPHTQIDISLRLTTARTLAEVEGTPVLTVNQYGEGKAILLNFSLAHYMELKGALEAGWVEIGADALYIKDFFRSLLSFAGVQEKVKATPAVAGLTKSRFASGNLRYLGLLQVLPEPFLNYSLGIAAPLVSTPLTLTLPRRYYIYNVREGSFVGFTDKIKTMIEPARAQLFSLLPYRVRKINLTLPEKVYQGNSLEYQATLILAAGTPELHIFHLSLISPLGEEVRHYSDNLRAEGGEVRGKIHLALNETPGEWKLRIKDVATGIRAEETFIVKEVTK